MNAGFLERTWYDLRPHLKEDPRMIALKDELRAEGTAKALLRLMEHRFGALPPQARAQVDAATLEQLDAWFDEALDADSVEAVLTNGRAG